MYKIFLVGGLIRDKILKFKANEKDWVILNSNYKTILNLGFKMVGKDFPVFLHPITKEEYALARKEKKIKIGYTGFKCYFISNIKLKEDLIRRDITINSLIMNKKGQILNYFNSINDIKNKKIRNVSKAFFEDPLRIIRLSRILSKYKNNGFLLSPKTYQLIKNVNKKEINKINIERIKKETFNSLKFKKSYKFFNILKISRKLKYIFSNINSVINFSKKFKFSKTLNTWNKIIKLIEKINKKSNNKLLKLSILIYKSQNTLKKKVIINEKLNLSKKYIKFISNIKLLENIYKKNKINKDEEILKIYINKNKIKILNILLIQELNSKINYYNYNFYKKYIILDILNKEKLKTDKDLISYQKKIKNFYERIYLINKFN